MGISTAAARRGRPAATLSPDRNASGTTAGAFSVSFADASVAEIAPIWQTLEDRFGDGGLANSWVWIETWLRHYGDLIPHRFLVAEHDGPRAIALVTEGVDMFRGPFRIRTLHVGTAGEPDSETVRIQYNRLLVDPAFRDEFGAALGALLRSSSGRWDEFRLDGFAPEEIAPLLASDASFVVDRRLCHVTDLSAIRAAGKRVIEGLDSHTAKKIRRSIRQIEEVHGPIAVEWAESIDQALDICAEMVALHEARWRSEGKPGVFASPRVAGFHRDLVGSLVPSGGILLARVRAGDVTLGCDYSFVERNRVLGYQWGVARLDDPRPSPGLVTGVTVMQEAMERGIDEYDWLSGDVFYKRQLSTTTRELVWARRQRGARIRGINALLHARGRARELSAKLPRRGNGAT